MKRIVLAILFATLLFVSPSPAHAQGWVGKNFGIDNDQAVLNNTVSKAPYLMDTAVSQMLSIICLITPVKGADFCTNDSTIQQSLFKKSAIGNIAFAIGSMYDNPPADLALWLHDTSQTLGFIPKSAYAQGVGFSGLAPLLPIWKAFRNISYALLALVMVVVGFMVMMRKRIDPKTVVTVQNALPRIVIALILITFSYAIVGALIDLMYVAIALLHYIIQGNLPSAPLPSPIRINYVSGGILDLFGSIFGSLIKFYPTTQVFPDLLSGQWAEAIEDFAQGIFYTTTGVGPLFVFIVSLAYLYAFVRILFMLLGAYTQVLLGVLTGPIQILADVFPGANAFTAWISNLVANLLVFPVTMCFLMIANAITWNFSEGKLWVPPFLPQTGATGSMAEMLISVGIIMTIPNVVNSIKESMKAKTPLEAGPGVIFGPLGRAGGTAMQGAYQISMISSGFGSVLGWLRPDASKHSGHQQDGS